MTYNGCLLEAMPARAIDLRPRLARPVDTLSALRDANGANAFAQIALRIDTWTSRRFGERLLHQPSDPTAVIPTAANSGSTPVST